jgi:hypothetical protein
VGSLTGAVYRRYVWFLRGVAVVRGAVEEATAGIPSVFADRMHDYITIHFTYFSPSFGRPDIDDETLSVEIKHWAGKNII